MSGHNWVFNSAIVDTTTSAKTIAHVRSASNHGILLSYAKISFRGTSATDSHILVQLVKQSSDGTATTNNPVEEDASHPDTLQATGREDFTVEPTTTVVLEQELVHPQGKHTFGPRIIDGGSAIGIRVTAPADVDCVVTMQGEE